MSQTKSQELEENIAASVEKFREAISKKVDAEKRSRKLPFMLGKALGIMAGAPGAGITLLDRKGALAEGFDTGKALVYEKPHARQQEYAARTAKAERILSSLEDGSFDFKSLPSDEKELEEFCDALGIKVKDIKAIVENTDEGKKVLRETREKFANISDKTSKVVPVTVS